ncbi:MAG: TAXI family TRAP transporter solute-binding subunit [Rhodospirillaceae bacterium]
MGEKSGWLQFRELAWIAGPVVALVLGAFWITALFIRPAPPATLVIAASSKGSPYFETAQRYVRALADSGVTLTVRETKGSIENLALLKDPGSGIDAAFLQGGLASNENLPGVRSIGRIFYEPVWIFYQGPTRFERLTDLVGKRVLVGPAGSGTNIMALRLLTASGVTAENTQLMTMELPDYVEALENGRADAGFLVLAPEARTVKRLLNSAKVRLMNLTQAEAYAQRFPFLKRVELKEGVVDFARDIPPTDTAMLTTLAAVVVREDLHPALSNLLTQAIIGVHSPPRLNAAGEAGIFQRAGVFPSADDQEFPLSPEAKRVYNSGPPFLQRYLPFWMATMADRLTVLLLPLLGILLPAVRFAPALYAWRVRQRIVYWYRELIKLETRVDNGSAPAERSAMIEEINRIERAVNRLPVPLSFANQLYDLREHIDGARRRLSGVDNGRAGG